MSEFLLDTDINEIVDRIKGPAQDFAGKTVLLTGGRGFLGRYFMEIFARLNDRVLDEPVRLVALDNLITAGKEGSEIPKYAHTTFVEHDVIKPFNFEGSLDYIIHAAGIASPFYYRAYPLETLEVAITGTRNMLELAERSDARVSFFSSSEIYGDPDPKHVPMAESYRGNVSVQGPRACYDESKRVGETLLFFRRSCSKFRHDQFLTPVQRVRPGHAGDRLPGVAQLCQPH